MSRCFIQRRACAELPDTPPLVVAEVLSLDDRLTAVREKLEEYKAWGVPHVWPADPHPPRLYLRDQGLGEVTSLQIPELGIELLHRIASSSSQIPPHGRESGGSSAFAIRGFAILFLLRIEIK